MEQMGSFQEKLKEIRATGSSGGRMVEVDLDGRMEMIDIRISPEAMEGGDFEMLQDLIIAAHSNAMENIKEVMSREMGALAGMSMGFPV